MQNLVALPMKFSFLEGKLHGWVFSAGTSGVKAACWCWQCWARQPRQALRGAVLGRPQPLPRVPGSACARPLANSLRGSLKINTWACWAAFLAKINTASLPAPLELGHTQALSGGTSSPAWPPPHESPHAGSSEAGWVPNPPADPSPSRIFCWFTGRKQSPQTKRQQGQQLTPSQGVGNQLSHAPDLQKLTAFPRYPP